MSPSAQAASESIEMANKSVSLSASPFRLLDLPLELRQQLLQQHLLECYRPPDKLVHESVLPVTWPSHQSPLLLVSKQISEEIIDIAQREKTFTYRITWQDATFDDWAKLCFRTQKKP